MGYVTILRTKCDHIDEKDFIKWLNSKNTKWWYKYGLAKTGKFPDQDDEADVKSFVPEAIADFNSKRCINSGDDIGCHMCLLQMIEEYLIAKHGAKVDVDEELYSETHLLVVKK